MGRCKNQREGERGKSKFCYGETKRKRGPIIGMMQKQLLLVLSIKEERAYWKRREVVSRPSLNKLKSVRGPGCRGDC
jgi:hypothetical protein